LLLRVTPWSPKTLTSLIAPCRPTTFASPLAFLKLLSFRCAFVKVAWSIMALRKDVRFSDAPVKSANARYAPSNIAPSACPSCSCSSARRASFSDAPVRSDRCNLPWSMVTRSSFAYRRRAPMNLESMKAEPENLFFSKKARAKLVSSTETLLRTVLRNEALRKIESVMLIPCMSASSKTTLMPR